MVIKVVHIDVVSDMTTEAFLACTKRFILPGEVVPTPFILIMRTIL